MTTMVMGFVVLRVFSVGDDGIRGGACGGRRIFSLGSVPELMTRMMIGGGDNRDGLRTKMGRCGRSHHMGKGAHWAGV